MVGDCGYSPSPTLEKKIPKCKDYNSSSHSCVPSELSTASVQQVSGNNKYLLSDRTLDGGYHFPRFVNENKTKQN